MQLQLQPYYSVYSTVGGVDFLDFRSLATEFRLEKNSKTRAEKAFFIFFMSSYTEMSFFGPKKVKKVTK
jgi:hypothetical protein